MDNIERFKAAYKTAVEREVEKESSLPLEDRWYQVPADMTVEDFAEHQAEKVIRHAWLREPIRVAQPTIVRVCHMLGISVSNASLRAFLEAAE